MTPQVVGEPLPETIDASRQGVALSADALPQLTDRVRLDVDASGLGVDAGPQGVAYGVDAGRLGVDPTAKPEESCEQ